MKYIPNDVYKSIYDIDFNKLYEDGYRFIISDLDNTLASYKETLPNDLLKNKIEEIKKLGFKFYLVSNNNSTRISIFNETLKTDGFLPKANKPKTTKLESYLKDNKIDKTNTIGLGDQLVTDILGFNRLGVYSILVKTIDKKTQKWYTKINRIREIKILKEIKKINPNIGRKIEEL